MPGPLANLRVLDIATFLAAPFCGTILADFGAEVIKIEQPGGGDSARRLGTPTECGDTLFWMSEGRNRKSITLDLRTDEGAQLFRQLVIQSDVVLENFRPGTLQRWGLSYEALAELHPKLVMLSISAYGQTGPYRSMPGFARIAHAFSGLAYLAGEPGRAPVVPGSSSLADYMSGAFGAIGVLVALEHVRQTGEGQQIDIGLYEPMFRMLDEAPSVYAATGHQRERMGPDTELAVPHSHYETADRAWVALACSNDRMWQRLTQAMGQPEWGDDSRFRTMPARIELRDQVNGSVAKWVRGLSLEEVLEHCRLAEVPCSKLLSLQDIFQDPHYAARGSLMTINDPRAGQLTLPAPLPRMSRTPPQLNCAGPALGDHNQFVFETLLGLSSEYIAELRQKRVI
jgi:crotonobetainyl-CoA:carnitine CoA-transferase CaiB-like acyl-CoA transferase